MVHLFNMERLRIGFKLDKELFISLLLILQSFDVCQQDREVITAYFPDNFIRYRIIAMSKYISKADNLSVLV